jgi:hypothetical protein
MGIISRANPITVCFQRIQGIDRCQPRISFFSEPFNRKQVKGGGGFDLSAGSRAFSRPSEKQHIYWTADEAEDTTMKRRAYWVICLIILLDGCSQMQSGGMSRAESQNSDWGMKLIAERIGEGPAAVTWQGNEKAILTVGDKKIEVQKEQILVDGVTKAKIPPGTKSIRAISRNDEVVVKLDSKEVFKLGP